MHKLFITISFAAMVLLLVTACKKNASPSPAEEQLIISTDAIPFSEVPGPGTNFNLTVISAMPPSGVKILVVVKGETDNLTYYTNPNTVTSLKTTNTIINNLPKQKICICTVTVISITKSSNTATTSFRIVYK